MNPNMKPRIPGKPIKFESDFDFEQANSKFEELFSKLKVGESANPDAKIEPEVVDIFIIFMRFLSIRVRGVRYPIDMLSPCGDHEKYLT